MELRRVIDFLYEGQPTTLWSNPLGGVGKIQCALNAATRLHESRWKGPVFDRETMRLKFEGVADAIWKIVRGPATLLDYQRADYHLLPT